MLEGKEVDGKFAGDAGHYSIDVKSDGTVSIAASFEKPADTGFKIKNELSAEVDLVLIVEKALEGKDGAVATVILKLLKEAFGR